MNKKMTELSQQLYTKRREAELALATGDSQKAATLTDEAEGLARDYDVAKRLYDLERDEAARQAEQTPPPEQKAATPDPWVAVAKFARAPGSLTADELALLTPSGTRKALTTGDSNGSDYLIPEDVDTAIRELRSQYQSAKDLVTVLPTEAMAGSFVFETGTPAGLTSFDDGDELPVETDPTFVQRAWKIALKGKVIPISNVLTGAERAGLMAYINQWFLRNAIISENTAIFSALTGAKAEDTKALDGWLTLRGSINVDLDPSCLIGGVVVTNQDGYNFLDTETDQNGRPLLTDSISTPGSKLFNGLPVRVFSNAQLPSTVGKAPVLYGDTRAGAFLIEKNGLGIASSEHALFMRNQKALRIIEGFATLSADAGAYCYGQLTLS